MAILPTGVQLILALADGLEEMGVEFKDLRGGNGIPPGRGECRPRCSLIRNVHKVLFRTNLFTR